MFAHPLTRQAGSTVGAAPSARVTLVLAGVLLALGGRAGAYSLRTDSSGTEVRWGEPVHFVVDSRLDSKLEAPGAIEAVGRAVATFADRLGELSVSATGGTASGSLGYDFAPGAQNQSEIVAVDDWSFDPDALAVTIVTVDARTHRILDADVAINARGHRFGVLGARPEGAERELDDVQNTVTHELGHALGLAHSGEVPSAVMYPTAHPGEVCKRALSPDDVDGLAQLYTLTPQAPAQQGCAAAPGPSMLAAFLFALRLLSRPSRSSPAPRSTLLPAALAAALAVPAFASPSERAPARVDRSEVVLTAEVVSARLAPPQPGDRILHTELTLKTRQCLKGGCSQTTTVRVPGGRLGDIEQWVEGEAPPRVGEVIAVALDLPAGPAAPRSSVYRLTSARDFDAFARGLSQAGLRLEAEDAAAGPREPATAPASASSAGSAQTRASR